ncbi:hypothetical protein [Salsipaludibacter albus]|uniref:hypothetical protein n=1 Tax=Salsipaludibacter albus TaxID=2849650 RepID=UPI001EE42399|nr:hypothetical protein [Salsipaludibacter albus]MBY5161363.1 hypothetical protein [Salsipaludibacter albus]
MKINKDQIIALLRSPAEPGDSSKVDQAQQELPQQVDTDSQQHQDLLDKFGINPSDLLSRLTGGDGLSL